MGMVGWRCHDDGGIVVTIPLQCMGVDEGISAKWQSSHARPRFGTLAARHGPCGAAPSQAAATGGGAPRVAEVTECAFLTRARGKDPLR